MANTLNPKPYTVSTRAIFGLSESENSHERSCRWEPCGLVQMEAGLGILEFRGLGLKASGCRVEGVGCRVEGVGLRV